MEITTSTGSGSREHKSHQKSKWLLLILGLLLLVLFAKIVHQRALPLEGARDRVMVSDPKCPTPEQQKVLDSLWNLYWKGANGAYDPTPYAKSLLAMAKTLGYPPQYATLDNMDSVMRFLRLAKDGKCSK